MRSTHTIFNELGRFDNDIQASPKKHFQQQTSDAYLVPLVAAVEKSLAKESAISLKLKTTQNQSQTACIA